MNRYIVYEGRYIQLNSDNKSDLDDFLEMGIQIKHKLGLSEIPIEFDVENNRVYVGFIVGNVTLNGVNLIILPKYLHGASLSDENIKQYNELLLSRTIKCAKNNLHSTIYFSKTTLDNSAQNVLFSVLAESYSNALKKALKTNRITQYETCIEKNNTVRGRILVQKQISNPINDGRIWCKYKRVSVNNIYNQLLFWCCKYLAEATNDFMLKRSLLDLSREFEERTDLLSVLNVSSLKLPRQFSEFELAFELARSIYLSNSNLKEVTSEKGRIAGYVINMEKSFENMVAYYIRAASMNLGYSHQAQQSYTLAKSISDLNSGYDVRPDNILYDGKRSLILDAKYKSLDGSINKIKPSSADFYQMVSTCIAYNTHEAILVYPQTSKFVDMLWETRNEVNGKKIAVQSVGIDLALTDEKLVQRFSEIVRNTAFSRR